jgi:long-subunit fatty acid transport protein
MRVRLGLSLSLATLLGARGAGATTVLELGDNGSEQMARGGAWVARASDPLAAFYNPAGLAGQETRLTLQGNINIQSTCFTRIKATNDGTRQDGDGSATIAPGAQFPQICNNAYAPTATNAIVPQLAFAYRVTPRLGLGLAIVTPSAGAASQTWPTTVEGGFGPQRYLLLTGSPVVITPTLGVGWEPIDNLRIGASFIWGIANINFVNDSWGVNSGTVANGQVVPSGPSAQVNDINGSITVSQAFIPGFTAGAIWSPTENIDIAGWYKFMSSIDAKGSVRTVVPPGGAANTTDTSYTNCYNPGGPPLCKANDVELKVPIPMEAKLGFRYHQPRAGVEQAHRRDPMATDVFDVEADLTWANDGAFQQIDISLPTIPVNGAGVNLPANASIPQNFSDVFGVRFGGDYNIVPDTLAIRAGGYYQTGAQPAEYQNIDFVGTWEAGLALGGTYRLHLGAQKSSAIELSIGFGHTFIGTSSYNTNDPQQTGVHALSGTPCNGNVSVGGSAPYAGWSQPNQSTTNGGCADGAPQSRTEWPVNLGTITNSFNQINLGGAWRF